MKDKRNHLVKSQKVREVNSKTTYGDFLATGPTDQFGNPIENMQANPDVLFESDGFYYQDPEQTEMLREKYEVVLEACKKLLTPLEAQIIGMLAQGKSLTDAAKVLGKSKDAINQTVLRARKKIQRYATRKGV